jgi:gluconate 2-dehydrogenase alpha chain
MPTTITEPAADVVILGVGFMSGVVAAELSIAKQNGGINYKVVAITKGPYWDYVNDFSTTKYDEWGVGLGRKYDSPLPLQSTTIRNTPYQFALPVRRYTMPIQYHALGHGVGGAAQHYGGTMGRMGPWGYQMLSRTNSRYSGTIDTINPHNDLEDWPLQYEQYEPYYVQWEQAHGLCGNYNGSTTNAKTDQNFPWMSQNYPLPPSPITPVGQLFQTAAQALGYHPFPHVSALASQPYTNQYGVPVNPCVYDGYCGGPCDYACETGAKANAAYRTIPAAMKSGNFTLVLNSFIFRLDTDPTTGLVTAARYYDPQGNVHIQPGKVFFNGMWGYNMIRIMLLSGIGAPYIWNSNPNNVSGTVGRGLTNGYSPFNGTNVTATLPNNGGNAYPAGNGSGGSVDIYDLMDDNFDHTGLGFIGGSEISAGGYPGGGPGNITFAGGVSSASMGGTFKTTQKDKYLQTKTVLSSTPFAPDLPTKDNYVDLDPHYTDVYGDPLARLTYDWTPNAYIGATWLAKNKVAPLFTQMGAQNVTVGNTVNPGAVHNDWWGHHLRGGCRIGTSPNSSVFNKWNQCWSPVSKPVFNIFGAGEITNTSGDTVPSGTHQAGPQSYRAAEGIKQYLALATPGLLT